MRTAAGTPLPGEGSSPCEGHLEWHYACDARDARYDGVFYVAITSTRIYCRPVCPSRRALPARRRFFTSQVAAEHAGFRPCRRCRPDLARGRTPMDAMARLAHRAADRIREGALTAGGVPALAEELGVSDRHLRRAVEREFAATPVELGITIRLMQARELLLRSHTSITRVAYDAGFGSLRRFNALFRERYRMTPTQARAGAIAKLWPRG